MNDVRRFEARSAYREAMRRMMDAEGPRVRRAAMKQLGLGYVPRTRKRRAWFETHAVMVAVQGNFKAMLEGESAWKAAFSDE